MRRSRQRKKHRSFSIRLFRWLFLVALVGVAFFSGVKLKSFLEEREKVQILTQFFERRSPEELSKRASESLELTLAGIGVGEDRIRKEESKEGLAQIWKVGLPSNISLLQCNLAVSKALNGSGVSVLDAIEEETDEGTLVRMKLSARSKLTHILELRQGENDKKVKDPLIAIVVDNLGGEGVALAEKFISLPVPLTFLVLPGEKASRELAQKALTNGKEVFVDIPMEPKGYPAVDPGKDAIYVDLPPSVIKRIMRKHLSAFPSAKGVSNHMGSLATQDRKVMRAILSELKKDELVFLDNLTTPNSVVSAVAEEVGVKCLRGGYVLDERKRDGKRLREKLGGLEEVCFERGEGIGTVRILGETLSELEKWIPEVRKKGARFVTLSELAGSDTRR